MSLGSDWRAYAIGSAFFAALTALCGKVGVSGMNSDLATFYRTLVVLSFIALVLCVRQEWQRPDAVPSKALVFLGLSGLATGMSWLCYYRAMQLGQASRVAPLDKLSVVFVVLLAAAFLGEKLNWKSGFGAALITVGAALMAL